MARPPNDRGQGRKPVPSADRLLVGSVRFTAAQWAKLGRLGGVGWLRERIEKAPIPAAKKP